MNIFIVSLHVVVAIILVLTVLLQAGKGAGMGAAFGGSSGTVFGTRGPATLISKITCGAAVIFMCTSLNLALSQRDGGTSVMEEYSAPAATPAEPSAPVMAPAKGGEAAAPAESPAPEAAAAQDDQAAAPAPAENESAPAGTTE